MSVNIFGIVVVATKSHYFVGRYGFKPLVQVSVTVGWRNNVEPAKIDIYVSEIFCQTGKLAAKRISTVEKDKFHIPVFEEKIGKVGGVCVFDVIAVTSLQAGVNLNWFIVFTCQFNYLVHHIVR